MINTKQRTAVPIWAVGVAVVIVLIAVILYGNHVLNPHASDSELKMPTSMRGPQDLHAAPEAVAPVNH